MNIPQDQLRADLFQGYGLDLTGFSPVSGGMDAEASVYRVHASDGRPYLLKLRLDRAPGAALALWLASAGVPEVLAPVPTQGGASQLSTSGAYAMLYPFLEGRNGFEQALRSDHWRSLGGIVAQIHHSAPPGQITEALPAERFTVDELDVYRTVCERLASSARLAPEERELADLIEYHRQNIEHVVERTLELGERCRSSTWKLVPCHADLHVGNVLIGPEEAPVVVDWDSPRMAPPECDFLFFCGPGITGHGDDVAPSFFEGYGHADIDPLALTYYRYARAMEDIGAFAKDALNVERYSQEERVEALRYFDLLFAPRMIVETAHRSSEDLF